MAGKDIEYELTDDMKAFLKEEMEKAQKELDDEMKEFLEEFSKTEKGKELDACKTRYDYMMWSKKYEPDSFKKEYPRECQILTIIEHDIEENVQPLIEKLEQQNSHLDYGPTSQLFQLYQKEIGFLSCETAADYLKYIKEFYPKYYEEMKEIYSNQYKF